MVLVYGSPTRSSQLRNCLPYISVDGRGTESPWTGKGPAWKIRQQEAWPGQFQRSLLRFTTRREPNFEQRESWIPTSFCRMQRLVIFTRPILGNASFPTKSERTYVQRLSKAWISHWEVGHLSSKKDKNQWGTCRTKRLPGKQYKNSESNNIYDSWVLFQRTWSKVSWLVREALVFLLKKNWCS